MDIEEEIWSEVVGRKAKRSNGQPNRQRNENMYMRRMDQTGKRIPRPSKRAAITLTVAPGSSTKYAEVMKKARRVKLKELGIEDIRCRRSISAAMVIEIPGKENQEKADKLATQLQNIFQAKKEIRVKRPEKMAEIRIRNLDNSVQYQEVIAAVARKGGCKEDQIMTREIRHINPRAMESIWIRYPLSAARKLAQLNRIVIGWSASRVEILSPRPMQCFKCLRTGHVKAQCRAMDRSGCCFRCGERGHAAKGCQALVKCPICSDLGAPAGHRMGSINCNPPGEKTLQGGDDVKVRTKVEEIKIERENVRGVWAVFFSSPN